MVHIKKHILFYTLFYAAMITNCGPSYEDLRTPPENDSNETHSDEETWTIEAEHMDAVAYQGQAPTNDQVTPPEPISGAWLTCENDEEDSEMLTCNINDTEIAEALQNENTTLQARQKNGEEVPDDILKHLDFYHLDERFEFQASLSDIFLFEQSVIVFDVIKDHKSIHRSHSLAELSHDAENKRKQKKRKRF